MRRCYLSPFNPNRLLNIFNIFRFHSIQLLNAEKGKHAGDAPGSWGSECEPWRICASAAWHLSDTRSLVFTLLPPVTFHRSVTHPVQRLSASVYWDGAAFEAGSRGQLLASWGPGEVGPP